MVYFLLSWCPITSFLPHRPLLSNEKLTICYRGLEVWILKTLDTAEAERLRALQIAIPGSPIHPNIVHFELLEGSHLSSKTFMAMEMMPTTLEPMVCLRVPHVEQMWMELSRALEFLHSRGFAHMDIKPSNICISSSQNFVLIDLGSIEKFGKRSASTEAYIPRDWTDRSASAAHDWWMLGMVLAEKGCGASPCVMGATAESIRKMDLVDHLKVNLPSSVFSEWKAKLKL